MQLGKSPELVDAVDVGDVHPQVILTPRSNEDENKYIEDVKEPEIANDQQLFIEAAVP